MRSDFLPFCLPTLGDDEINEVVHTLKSGWLATGPKVKRFEEMLGEYIGAPYTICLASATAGLHLAMMALDFQPGDEVITSPMTFAATLNMIELTGGTVRLVDVDPLTYNLDVNQLEAAITPRTRAIVPVHFTGSPVDLDPLYALAEKYGLRVIEDAAQSIGTEYKGRRLGSFGDTTVFSFHPNKNMTTGEGGCLVTFDAELAQKVALLKFHGMDREAWNRFGKAGNQHYEIVTPGFKYNMMDIQAALGIHQLPKLNGFIHQRHQLVQRYQDAFENWTSLQLPRGPLFPHLHAWHLFAPLIQTAQCGKTRDEFMEEMKTNNIGTGLHYRPVHLYPYYREKYGFKEGDFPNAEHIGEHIVSLPLYPNLSFSDQDSVIETMRTILGESK